MKHFIYLLSTLVLLTSCASNDNTTAPDAQNVQHPNQHNAENVAGKMLSPLR